MSKPQFFAFSTFVFSLLVCNEASRILVVVPTPAISHQVVFRPLTQELARRGHEVVVVTPNPAFPKGKAPPNLIEIDIHNVSYSAWGEMKSIMSAGNKPQIINAMAATYTIIRDMLTRQFTDETYLKLIQDKTQHFDLLILEAWVRPILALSHAFKAPVIQMSSFGAMYDSFDNIGAPSYHLLYPVFMRQRMYNLSMWDKVNELYNNYKLVSAIYGADKHNEELLRKIVGPDMPSLNELSNNVDMLFLNLHPLWDGNRPVPPGVVYIGGIHGKPEEKDLPKDLKTYLDSSIHGVIYISFGTTVPTESIPKEMVQNIIKCVSQLPYDILWKWDQDELPGQSPNIRISKWLPQPDILRHPKIKLFLMQGGLQSTDEAINAGVPMIALPLAGDQWYNAEKFVHLKIGLQLDAEKFTADDLKNAIKTIIEDDSYRRNVVKLHELLHDQPQKPLERAVWWTEHVLRHGARHLRAPAANITWTQYLELHLVFTLGVGLIASITLVVLIVKYISKCVFGKSSNAKKNN